MHPFNKNGLSNMTTPKRMRRGTRRVVQNIDGWRERFIANSTPVSQQIASSLLKTPERCESPALPCNQVEYLHDSDNNSVSSEIPCSPGVADINDLQNWESLITNVGRKSISVLADNEISDEMFQSKLELEFTQNKDIMTIEELRQEVDKTFEAVNQSIVNHGQESLFETKDSFLLDIQTGKVMAENNFSEKTKNVVECKIAPQIGNSYSFYGLPMITKGLFKTYRNIDKLYDWQEECLNLDAIKERQNLIYALPTSGGKTLVAEVLMLREVLNRKQNVLFILPFVAIVQEKIWALSPFAVQLEFLVEEYAAGKGHIPPKKRRKKNSIYVATIEKGLALIRSLIEVDRLQEIGLIVVDELHLIGEQGRGGTLETLLTTIIFANKDIQIIGMSATIGNLEDLASYLRATVFQRQFRPVELLEYVKLGDVLYRLLPGEQGLEVLPDRQLAYNYSSAATSLDPDFLGGLVSEVVPESSCLVFCPTKRNCENVAALLCKLQRNEMASHRSAERTALSRALRAEGASGELVRAVRCGVAFHHAGLAADERSLLEQAFRSGVISVLCCTSTLAAGVNLPARRVIVRAPHVGRDLLSLGAYRQMTGRAGRAGVCDTGESILICPARDWPEVRRRLAGGLPPARSVLEPAVPGLLLSAVALRLATEPRALQRLIDTTLFAVTSQDSATNTKQLCEDALRTLLESGVLELAGGDCAVRGHSQLLVSKLGQAAIKGCLEVSAARQLLQELAVAARGLVLMGSLHLLYLVTPHDTTSLRVRIDYRHYYSLYCNLDEEGVQTAKVLGITEVNAIRMMTGKPITNVPEKVLYRFYLALMLHDLWKQLPFPLVAEKYQIPRGTVQSVMCTAASFAACAQRVCEEMDLWTFKALFEELAVRLRHCAAPELHQLMELPAVKKARALQLARAGYKRIEDLAKASVEDLVSAVTHLSRTTATHLISAARMMLIEKVENLRAEAEDVMEELK